MTVGSVDRDRAAAEVVAVLSAAKSTWSEAELTAEVDAGLVRAGVVGDPQAVAELAEDVRARAAARCRSVLDPAVHTPTSMSRHLTSDAVVEADRRLNLGLAGLAGGPGDRDDVGAARAVAAGLDRGQAAAVGAVGGQGRLAVVVGPAGAGKTAMLAVAGRRLAEQGRAMVVVSPTRKGALVAGAEIGVAGASLAKLLHEHGWRWDELGRWSRLAVGEVDRTSGPVYRGPGEAARLSERSVVVVDEAGLLSVDQANALIDVAAETGAAVRLVGDPRQLGAVGRGGVMETAARWVGSPVVLDQVHRFVTVAVDGTGLPVTVADREWAELSLRVRDGTDPAATVDRLVARGAVVVHARPADAVAAIAEAVAAGGDRESSWAVTVATNDDARRVNQAVRDRRVAAGRVDDTAAVAGRDGERIGVGDRIVTRRNDPARDVANRETWTVEAVARGRQPWPPGGPGTAGWPSTRAMSAAAVQLGYASTDYGNQGVTTDRSVTWVTDATSAGGLYVGVTRGRYANTVHVVAADVDEAPPAAGRRPGPGPGRPGPRRGDRPGRDRGVPGSGHPPGGRSGPLPRRPGGLALRGRARRGRTGGGGRLRPPDDRPGRPPGRPRRRPRPGAPGRTGRSGGRPGPGGRAAGRGRPPGRRAVRVGSTRRRPTTSPPATMPASSPPAPVVSVGGPGRSTRPGPVSRRPPSGGAPRTCPARNGPTTPSAAKPRRRSPGPSPRPSTATGPTRSGPSGRRPTSTGDRPTSTAARRGPGGQPGPGRAAPRRSPSAVEEARAVIAHHRSERDRRTQTMTPDQVEAADAARDALLAEQALERAVEPLRVRAGGPTPPPPGREGPGLDL